MFEVTTRVEVQKCDTNRLFTSTLSLYILSLKNTFILQTEVYSVPECNFSNCLWYFLALKIMFMWYLKNGHYNQDNFPCIWCISAVPISVFSRGDHFGISKGMKITCTAYSRANKIIQLYHMFIQKAALLSRTLGLNGCFVQKAGFVCF